MWLQCNSVFLPFSEQFLKLLLPGSPLGDCAVGLEHPRLLGAVRCVQSVNFTPWLRLLQCQMQWGPPRDADFVSANFSLRYESSLPYGTLATCSEAIRIEKAGQATSACYLGLVCGSGYFGGFCNTVIHFSLQGDMRVCSNSQLP